MSNGSNDKDSIGEGYTEHFRLLVEEDSVSELKKLTKERISKRKKVLLQIWTDKSAREMKTISYWAEI